MGLDASQIDPGPDRVTFGHGGWVRVSLGGEVEAYVRFRSYGNRWRTINVNGDSIPRWAEDLIAAVGAGRWDFRAAPEPTDIPPAPVPPGEQKP